MSRRRYDRFADVFRRIEKLLPWPEYDEAARVVELLDWAEDLELSEAYTETAESTWHWQPYTGEDGAMRWELFRWG